MARLLLVAFLGPAKSHDVEHARESPKVMTLPLVALAVPSALGGFFGIAQLYQKQLGEAHSDHSWSAMAASLCAVIVGLACGLGLYRNAEKDPLPEKVGALARCGRRGTMPEAVFPGPASLPLPVSERS